MKKKLIVRLSIITATLVLAACDDLKGTQPVLNINYQGHSSFDSGQLRLTLDSHPSGEINTQEREEEKLAHDVYSTLYNIWTQQVFINISNSEQTPSDTLPLLINRHNEIDPVDNNIIGIFTDTTLQSLYDNLVAQSSSSLIDALMVAATIEEIDMIDINNYIIQVNSNDDIVLVYDGLLKGSRHHLRSFVSNLEQQGIISQPQHMDITDFNSIINSDMEKG